MHPRSRPPDVGAGLLQAAHPEIAARRGTGASEGRAGHVRSDLLADRRKILTF
jgi:hypothetical protein